MHTPFHGPNGNPKRRFSTEKKNILDVIKWKIMNFYEKNWYISVLLFFSVLRSNFLDFDLNHNVGDTMLHILKIFSGEVMIAFSEVITKNWKSHIFWSLFCHILWTTSSPLLIFLPHSLTHIPYIMTQLFCFSPIYLQNW